MHDYSVQFALLSILLKAYSDVPPMYFPIPGHPLISKNISLSCPPPVLANTGEGHDSKNIFSIMSPLCIGSMRKGDIDMIVFFLLSYGWPCICEYVGRETIKAFD